MACFKFRPFAILRPDFWRSRFSFGLAAAYIQYAVFLFLRCYQLHGKNEMPSLNNMPCLEFWLFVISRLSVRPIAHFLTRNMLSSLTHRLNCRLLS